MAERILCGADPSVRLDGFGDRALVVVKDGSVARFWTDTSELESVLEGFPLQLSAHDGTCLLRAEGDTVTATFSLAGGPLKSCSIRSSDLYSALQAVREASDDHNLVL